MCFFIAPIDYCVALSCVWDFLWKTALISFWNDFSLNPGFGEVYFLEESYENMQKN